MSVAKRFYQATYILEGSVSLDKGEREAVVYQQDMKNSNLSEIKKIISKIAERYRVSKVLLFGSRVKGEEKSDSDQDKHINFLKNLQ